MADTTTAAETLSNEWVEEFGKRYFAALNSHEPERFLELMTEDVVFDDSGALETMRGHAEVRDFMEAFFRAIPDVKFEPEPPLIAADGPRAAFWWRCWGTNTGPMYGLPATGKEIDLEGADCHEYRDGKLVRLRVVYDMADVFRQLDLMPELDVSASG